MLAAMIPAYAQNRSPKRGICWDEKLRFSPTLLSTKCFRV